MKRVFLSALALLFGLFLVGVSVVVVTAVDVDETVVAEKDMMVEENVMMEKEEEEGTESGEMVVMEATGSGEMDDAKMMGGVEYYLPYPGILPDHPMYWLKMIRDRVMLWLTRDTTKKLDRLLLYADKRIGAAEALADGNQLELAVSTATKAEKYLDQVVAGLEELSEEERGDMEGRVRRAVGKHIEILEAMDKVADGEAKGVLLQVTESTKESLKRFEADQKPESMRLPEEDGDGATASGEMMEMPAEIDPSL